MYKLTPLDRKRGLRIPEMSEALAEIIGIHFGDGTMEDGAKGPAATYTIGYAMDARRPNYTEFVKNIFYDTFHITFHSYKYKSKQCIVLYYRSKTICTFFNRELKVPYGKKNRFTNPYIHLNERCLFSCVFARYVRY